MKVQTSFPLTNAQQVLGYVQQQLPNYKCFVRQNFVVVGNGSATGVLIRPEGANGAKLIWAFPSMGVQLLLTLSIVLSGILPGLILFGIVWLSVKSGVEQIRKDVAGVLSGQGGQAQLGWAGGQQAGQQGYAQAPQQGHAQAPQQGYAQAPQQGHAQAPQQGYAQPQGGQGGWGQGQGGWGQGQG
jgi:hypothetical protein